MEKQNNDDVNNRIEVNEVKSVKKKVKVSTIVIIVLAVLLLFSCVENMAGSGSSTLETTSSTTTEDKNSGGKIEETIEPEDEEETDAVEDGLADESDEESDPGDTGWSDEDYVYNPFSYDPETDTTHTWIGDTLHLVSKNSSNSGGVDVTVLNCSVLINHIGEEIVYVEVEIENNSTEDLSFYGGDMMLYIDDYQITTDPTLLNADDTTYGNANISSGRKAKTSLRLVLPSNYYKADKIEVDLFGLGYNVMVKDEGYYIYGRRDALDIVAEELATKEEEAAKEAALQEIYEKLDSISIDESLCGDHAGIDNPDLSITLYPSQGLYFNAELVMEIKQVGFITMYVRMEEDSEREGYLTQDYPESADESENKCGTIYFGMDGIRIELDDYPEYNGVYW